MALINKLSIFLTIVVVIFVLGLTWVINYLWDYLIAFPFMVMVGCGLALGFCGTMAMIIGGISLGGKILNSWRIKKCLKAAKSTYSR